jgi:hypothetical protein
MVDSAADDRDYTIADVNPKSQTAKGIEMTVLRALELIEAFDALEDGADWTAVPGATYRRIIGEQYKHGRVLEECWKRYQDGTLYRQVQDLAANLPPSALGRKEIADGLARINARPDSRGKRRPTKPTPRRRPRQQRLL